MVKQCSNHFQDMLEILLIHIIHIIVKGIVFPLRAILLANDKVKVTVILI